MIGVLALQGNFREHISMLDKLKIDTKEIRLDVDLKDIGALIIPGGESTTISRLMKLYGLDKAILEKHKHGMAIMATCAGTILLAKDCDDKTVNVLPLLDIKVQRNAYGTQKDSFEDEIIWVGEKMHGIFIRAPKILSANCKVLARHKTEIVAVQQDNILATTFHPELTDSTKVHEYFINEICKLSFTPLGFTQ